MFDQQFIDSLATKVADIVASRLKKEPAIQIEYLTYEQVGQMIGRTEEGVRYLVKQGKLPICDEFGRRPRIHIEDVRTYMTSIKRWAA
jgi:hypothetical protein